VHTAPARRLTVEHRASLEFDAVDALALGSLLDTRPSLAVFLSPAWLSGFFADPPAGDEPALAVFREEGALRGMAPIAVRRTFTHVRVSLLGGAAGSDRTDLVAARGYEASCADLLLSWLEEAFGRDAVLELRDVPAESPIWGAIHRANQERRPTRSLQPRDIHTLPYLDLNERETAPGARGPGRWHPPSLDKHRRWLERRGDVRIERLEDAGEVLRALDTLRQFLHARWEGQERGSVLDDARSLRFHQHVLPRLLAEKRLRMLRFSSGTRPIAVFYGVASAGWWGYFLAGYDREWAGRIRLGQITLAAAIDRAEEEGAAEFDFLKGAHRTKYLWPVRERATLDADVYLERPGAQLERAARAVREAAAGLAKSARSIFSR
jgi:CelD/BcsL family acetyltransferase involved in cellulose biosynthesis